MLKNNLLRQKMAPILLERYGVDIAEAKCYFSTQNYAFIFPGQPYMIRVSMTSNKSRAEILSELMWVDDLKQFKQTICEPNTSLRGKLLEEFEIDGVTYRASMFRTARGGVEPVARFTPMFFICVGDLLGAIHRVSTDEREQGIRYKRSAIGDQFAARKARVAHRLSPEMLARIEEIEAKVNALPRETGEYGICHGDFHANNFFVDANNIWLFDFDGCCYAHYMYDAASMILDAFLKGYGAGEDCRQVLEEKILPYIRTGYEINHNRGAHYWDNLELFMAYRTAYSLLAMEEIGECGLFDIEQARRFFRFILLQEDILAGMTQALAAGRSSGE